MIYYYHPGIGILGGLFSLVIFVLVFSLLIMIIRRVIWQDHLKHGPIHPGNFHNHPQTKPLDILKERYAKGEINKEEFEQKKKDLES